MHPQKPEKRWSQAITIWWAMMWRFTLLLVLLMGLGMKLGQWLMPYDTAGQHQWEMALFALLLPVLGVYSLRAVLNRDFGTFRLMLVPRESEKAMPVAPQQAIEDKFHTESDK